MNVSSYQEPTLAQTPIIEDAERAVAPWIDVPYEEQLQRKEHMVRDVLGRALESCIQPVLPSPQTVGHRNKMEFSFGYDGDEKPALGFHQRKKFWRITDLNRSLFLTAAANRVYGRIKRFAFESGLPFYRQIHNHGFFRYLVIREGKRTGEVLANVVVNPVGFEEEMPSIKAGLLAATEGESALASLWLSLRRSVGDAAIGEKSELLVGAPTIHEKILDLTFRISPLSFFQVNSYGTEVLYGKLRRLVADWPQRQGLVDLFCGSGGIALAMSQRFQTVWGVDADAESIRLAIENADLNQIRNATFICAKARRVRDVVPPSSPLIVVDPPRVGLSPKVARHLVRLAPERLIYISCNPQSFREDMGTLNQLFRVEEITPVDLFPHTPHLELIVSLVSIEADRGAFG